MKSKEEELADAIAFFTSSVKHALEAIDSRMDHIEAALARTSSMYIPWKLPDELRAEIEKALADAPEVDDANA